MTQATGLSSYANGTKQTWRGWQWNRICDRIPKHKRRDAVVAYLCGPDDFDRACAIKRGFVNQNIVAVDVSEENVTRIRRAGGVGIVGNLADILVTWQGHTPLAAIVADFCGGMNKSAIDFTISLLKCPGVHVGTVVAANFLRGRDCHSNEFRSQFANVDWTGVKELVASLFSGDASLADFGKHRAFLWSAAAWIDFAAAVSEVAGSPGDARGLELALHMRSQPRYYSYMSGNNVFDSVVLSWPLQGPESSGDLSSWAQMREQRIEAKRPVRFRRQSLIASHARLTHARGKLNA